MKRLLSAGLISGSMLWAQAVSKPPDAASKALVERVCSKCHDLEGTTRSKNYREGWAKVVDDMIARGAEATDPEAEQIIDYLTSNYGRPKVDVNKATPRELAAALAVPSETASAIVAYREKNGALKEWQDLAKVPGVDMTQIADKKDRVEFGETK
jgi:competence ComEA-like helix-hairpin-helix protein